MRVKHVQWLVLCLLVLLGHAPIEATAKGLSTSVLLGKPVVRIEVTGNRYIESAALVARLKTKEGADFNRHTLSRDIQALYASGNYADLKVLGELQGEGVKLTFHVKENPFITAYHMDGNEEVTYKDMKRKLKLKEGVIFSQAKLRSDINTIRKGYLKKGFYQLRVKADKKLLEDGSMSLTMHVIEGEKTHVRKISFVGNKSFSDAELADKVSASISGLIPWFSNKDVIDTKKFSNDAQMLIEFYQNHGFLDVNVESAQLSLTPDKKAFYLTFAIHEGPVYHVSSLNIQGDMEPSREKLLEAITMQEGQVYSVSDLRETISAMSLLVGDEGYAFNNVTPLFKRNTADNTVGIVFDVEKGREVYIERIEIEGNEKTDDGVIRREMRLDESQRYSATGMKQSKTALTRLSLFKDVRIAMPRGSSDDRVNAKVTVEEDKTGSFVVGAGFSQIEKVIFRIKTSEKNLFGKGYGADVTADIGKVTQNFNLSLRDPYFMDTNVAASLNLNKKQTKLSNTSVNINPYTQDDFGGGVNFAIPLSESSSYSIGYQYTNSNLTNIASTASFLLLSQAGKQTTSALTQVIAYDTRDRLVGTTRGVSHSASISIAGLGGKNKFWESGANLKAYLPITDNFVLSASLAGKIIQGYSGLDVPIYRRYSLGGVGSLRGFDYYGVSLRDPKTGDPVGGDKQVIGDVSIYFPLPYVQTSGIRGVVFTDMGTVWGKENLTQASSKFSVSNMRVSTGFGIEWISPVGPLTLTWARALRKQPDDLLRSFEFGLGQSF